MKTFTNTTKISVIASIVLLLVGCNKQDDYLDVKSNNFDVVPTTLEDFQAILDNNQVMNQSYPCDGLIGTDNFYLTNANYKSLQPPETTAYIWAQDIWGGDISNAWNTPYQMVEYANVALDGIKKISENAANQKLYNQVKGSALFYRAIAYYYIASLFCKPYIKSTANTDLGIILRSSSDINLKSTRSSVGVSYDQIVSDLLAAMSLLPKNEIYTRPTSTAAYALLAKVYLSMEDYTNANKYASKSIAENASLLDFNNANLVKLDNFFPFPTDPSINPEMLFYASGLGNRSTLTYGRGFIDSVLYKSYDNNDLRKTAFFYIDNAPPLFKGTYAIGRYDFAGIGNNEIYFIRAESNARLGNNDAALSDLNLILQNRYKSGTFTSLTNANVPDLLGKILLERRKELPLTGNIRWEDLRRLNKDPNYAITLTKIIDGITYKLPPNSSKYVYPIPNNEIQLNGVEQNIRK